MHLVAIVSLFLLQSAAPAQPAAAPPADKPAQVQQAAPAPDVPTDQQLLTVKRIYVDSFGDDAVSKQIQAMVVTQLTDSKRFIVTENKDKADAILRGSGLEKDSQEYHSYSEGTAAGAAGGGWSAGPAGGSGGFGAMHAATEDAAASTETIHEAHVAVRLVNRDGDVLWATTQESKGAKYKGASADVADKVVKELLRTLDKLQAKQSSGSSSGTTSGKQ